MGYLDNTSITVDAILTKKGRELLAQGGIGAFQITQFALADDEIDYTMFNENHPNGTQYSGEAIENMAITEAFPDENNIMQYKLLTLNEGTSVIPFVSVGASNISMAIGEGKSIDPMTHNYNAVVAGQPEPNGYRFTIADNRLFDLILGGGTAAVSNTNATTTLPANTTAQSAVVVGTNLQLTAKSATSLFGTFNSLTTTLTVEGLNTGARITIPITVNKTVTNFTTTSGDSTTNTTNSSAGV
jgi:hypothetical protein